MFTINQVDGRQFVGPDGRAGGEFVSSSIPVGCRRFDLRVWNDFS
jgi:hypothetical protein